MRMPIIICFVLIFFQAGYGQLNKNQVAGNELQKLADSYKKTSRLSFDVTYRYAAAENPNTWLDSLSGHCKLSGARYWYEMDNIESVRTSQYVIILFKEEQLMYLAKPANNTAAVAFAADAGAALANPAGQLESFLKKDTAILCSVSDVKNQKKITIDFAKPAMYKRIEYYINKQTGFLEKMVSWVSSDQLYDASVRSLVDAEGSYAIVEAVYTNYNQGAFDDNLFSNDQYFKKEGNDFVSVAPYHTYKIFQGTPNQ